jgi:HD superfamily phosphohydrolase
MKCAGEYSRIIKDCTVFEYNDGKSIIAWPIKLQYEIFQLFATRYRLHKQVYNHPNVKACEFIIIDMLKKISQTVDLQDFGDSIIFCKYGNTERNKLFLRNHPKFVGEFTFVSEKIYNQNWEKYIKYMDENKIFYQKLQIGFGGNRNPLKNIKFDDDNKIIKNN